MIVITANLGRGVNSAVFKRNALTLRRTMPRAAIFFQEIDEADTPNEHAILEQLFSRAHGDWAGWKTHTPIWVPKPWKIEHERIIHACDGLSHLSPARYFVLATVRNENRPSLPRIKLLDGHYPRKDPRLESRRRQCLQVHRGLMLDTLAGRELLIWGMDTNTSPMVRVVPEEHVLHDRGLDHIRYIRGRGAPGLRALERGTVDLNIDSHNAPWAQFKVLA